MAFEIKIRDTEKEDISFLYQWLSHVSSKDAYLPATQQECEINSSMWMYYTPLKSSLTATVNGEPVGICLLQLNPFKKIMHHAEVSIIVSSEYKRSGVGTLLMEEIFKIAKERFKLEFLHLFVHEGTGVINFYKKLGFQKYGSQKKWLKDPETNQYKERIFFQKSL